MTDKELLELAAKAAGIECYIEDDTLWGSHGALQDEWNPLLDDGDALRLAVNLGLDVWCSPPRTEVGNPKTGDVMSFEHDGDPYAATRRAIVFSAAEMGKVKK